MILNILKYILYINKVDDYDKLFLYIKIFSLGFLVDNILLF